MVAAATGPVSIAVTTATAESKRIGISFEMNRHENARSPCDEKRATVREEREPNLSRASRLEVIQNALAGQQRETTAGKRRRGVSVLL